MDNKKQENKKTFRQLNMDKLEQVTGGDSIFMQLNSLEGSAPTTGNGTTGHADTTGVGM